MPKVGMKPVRQMQLIEATLASVEQLGLQHTTINTISKIAGVSTGTINHYFGGKQGLLEATVLYLLKSLGEELMANLRGVENNDPMKRIEAIIKANFSPVQTSDKSAKTWMAFWSQAMHDKDMAHLQKINERRLFSNLKYSYKQLVPAEVVDEVSQSTAAIVDGLWLRRALSTKPLPVEQAERYCMSYIRNTVAFYQSQFSTSMSREA